jgi:hypothetical protein
MVEDDEIIRTIQEYCRSQIFEKIVEGQETIDRYRQTWLKFAEHEVGMAVKEERLSRFTTKRIQSAVLERFGTMNIDIERRVMGSSNLAFDLWNKTERTAFEICLGAIKNEFEKDILKGILDKDTTKLVIFYREYGTGTQGKIYGRKWFEHPAQKEMMDRAGIFKLAVLPVPLV